MAHLFCTPQFNKFFLYITLTSFSMTFGILPAYASPQSLEFGLFGNKFSEAALLVRLNKTIERLMKLEKSGKINEMIDLMLEVKGEVENYTGISISLDRQISTVQNEMRSKGYNISKNQLDDFKKRVNNKLKNANGRIKYVATILEVPEAEFDIQDELICYISADQGGQSNDEGGDSIPVRVAFGITVALCGLFLFCLPIPPAKVWGQRLMETGVLIAVEGGISHAEKPDKRGTR